jgi:DNA helicase-2/ATP-dependent DNA helicase PcrA
MALAQAATPSVAPLLDALDPEQRAAATLPDGPAQIIAPAGSGKTTTLIARLGVLLTRGVPAERIAVVTFNREAGQELSARIATRLGPRCLGGRDRGADPARPRPPGAPRRRRPVHLVADRLAALRAHADGVLSGRAPDAAPVPRPPSSTRSCPRGRSREGPARRGRAALASSRPAGRTRRARLRRPRRAGGDLLEQDAALRARWQGRFSHLAVDEFQDVDAAQLRLVRILAEPEQNLFVVGDDDQTIYAWRLADVRGSLASRSSTPARGASSWRRITAVRPGRARITPADRANAERFEKRIEATPGRRADPSAIVMMASVGPDWADRLAAVAASEAASNGGCCILARTRAELTPVALALLRAGRPHCHHAADAARG